MPPFPQPDWPPNNATESTQLVIISTTHSCVSESVSKNFKIPETMKQGYFYKSDKIMAYDKKEVQLSDILSPVPTESKDDPPKAPKVLMDGAPGVGKTTLAIKACIDWAKGRLFRQYELVILVSLRQAKYESQKELKDLFSCCHDQRVIEHCLRYSGEHVLLIFDGYDELSFRQRECQSIFLDIIRGEVLPKCAVIVTSRPYASKYLHGLKSINRHVEVLGFKKEQIHTCIQRNLSDSSNAEALIKQLEEREDILSLCYIPLNCLIMIHVYDKKKALSTTMTKLFHEFIIDSVTREVKYVNKTFQLSSASINDLGNLPKPVDTQLASLEKIAFECLCKDQFIFSQKELQSAFTELHCPVEGCDISSLCLGLITSVYSDDQEEHYFQFLHLSIQEYLAARYAVSSKKFEQVAVLQMFVDDPRFKLFLLFYVGMMPLSKDTFKTVFRTKLIQNRNQRFDWEFNSEPDPIVSKFLYFAHMIFESQDFETFPYLLDLLTRVDNNVLSLKRYKLTQFDCTVLANFLCSTEHSWQELDMQNCSLSVSSLKVINRVYQQHKRPLKTTFQSINLSENDANIVNKLELFPWLSTVERLTFESNVEAVSEPLKLKSIAHIPKLCIEVSHNSIDDRWHAYSTKCTCKTNESEVTLCQTSLGEMFGKYLEGIEGLNLSKVDYGSLKVVTPFIKTLKVLAISDIHDIDGWLHQSLSSIAHTKSLQTLTLLNIGLTCNGAMFLFQAVKDNKSIRELIVSGESMVMGNLEPDLGHEMEALLSKNKAIESLQLCNCMSNRFAHHFISGLKRNSTLKKLDVSNNSLTISNIESFISTVRNHTSLTEFSIEDNQFKKSSTKWTLCKPKNLTPRLLCALSNLEHLHSIDSNVEAFTVTCDDLDSFTFISLFQALQKNKCIKHLKVNGSIQHIAGDKSVACALERMLSGNSTLETLDFHVDSEKEPDSLYKYLSTGISKNTSLMKLDVKMHSLSGIACLVGGLSSCRLKEFTFDLTSSRHHSSPSPEEDCSKLVKSALENLLTQSDTLIELNIGRIYFSVDDTILAGIVNGLEKNKCLKTIQIRFAPTVSRGAEIFFLSVCNSALTSVVVRDICFLSRKGSSLLWTIQILERGLTMWSQLKHIFMSSEDTASIHHLSVMEYLHSTSYQISELISSPNLRKNLRTIDFSNNMRITDCENISEGKRLGKAIKTLLAQSNSLELLTFKGTWIPRGTWEYAADGLKKNKSLKSLDLSKCRLLPSDATKIFSSLASNCFLEKLDLSRNPDIKDYTMDTSTNNVDSSIQKMFKSNSSIIEINLAGSINDELAKKALNGLHGNTSSSLKRLGLDETSLNISTMQGFLSLIEVGGLLKIDFTEISFSRENADSHNMWSDFVNLTFNNIFDSKECRSSKLFCSLCQVCLENEVMLNITALKLSNVVDDDTVLVIFSLLVQTTLSQLRILSLETKYKYHLTGLTIGNALKKMLLSNKSLRQLTLPNIDDFVLAELADGLSENNTMEKVNIELDAGSINESNVAILLHAMNSPHSGLLHLEIQGIPPISRSTRWSQWHWGKIPSACGYRNMTLIDRLIYSLCRICNDQASDHSSVARCILSSWQKLSLRVDNPRDFAFVEFILSFLVSDDIFKKLYLDILNSWMVRNAGGNVCTAIKDVLVNNVTLENLILSGDFDAMSSEVLAGLQANKGLKMLQIEGEALSMRSIATILDTLVCSESSSISRIAISNVFTLEKHDGFLWQIEVLDKDTWPSFLYKLTQHTKPLSPLKWFAKLVNERVYFLSPRFDVTCKHLNFCDEEARVTDAGKVELCGLEVSKIITEMKSLDLEYCGISDDMCNDIASGLKSSNSLEKLNLRCNSIHEKGVVKLFQAMEENCTLQELDVSYSNHLDDSTTDESVGTSLECVLKKKPTCLKTLKLQFCDLKDKTYECIAAGMEWNDSLLCLDLSHTSMSCNGLRSLLLCLKSNSCLQKLNVSGNILISDSNSSNLGQALHEMLICNKTLSVLHMNFKIDDTILNKITSGLQSNSTLKILTLGLDLNKCSKSCFESLIMTTKLACFNFANDFSLCSSDSGWTVEIKELTESFAENYIFCTDSIPVYDLVVSKSAVSSLNFIGFNLSGSVLIHVFESLEYNETVTQLKMKLNGNLTEAEREAFGKVLKDVLTKNTALKDLQIYGNMGIEIVSGIDAGLKSNTCLKEILLQIDHHRLNVIANFIQSTKATKLLKVSIYPLIEISREKEYNSWKICSRFILSYFFEFYGSIYKSTDTQIVANMFNAIQLFDFREQNIDDAMFSSLFCALEGNISLKVLKVKMIGKMAHCPLEKMLAKNKVLQELYIDSVNDSVASAIAKGLKPNHSLQTLCINVNQLSEDCLAELLQALSTYPLKLIDELNGCHVRFVRSISLQHEIKVNESFIVPRESPNLAKIFKGFKPICCLEDLTISHVPQKYFTQQVMGKHEDVSSALTELLKICNTLHVLKIVCPVSAGVILGLSEGLKVNHTLHYLQLNTSSLGINDILPIFTALRYSEIDKLELLNRYLFWKMPASNLWKINFLRYFDESSYTLLSYLDIEIDTVICNSVGSLDLMLSNENYKTMLTIFKSVEVGTFPVYSLRLRFVPAEYEEIISYEIAIAIQKMLKSNGNKSLETLTLECLRDQVVIEHFITGLIQNSSLANVTIIDDHQIENNFLAKKVLSSNFNSTSICEMQINDICLDNGTIKDESLRWKRQRYFEKKDNNSNTWRVKTSDKKRIARMFIFLSKIYQSSELHKYTDTAISMGAEVLQSLKKLDFSFTRINIAEIFEVLQFDSQVVELNLSYCDSEVDGTMNMRQTFKEMLKINTSLKVLNLTGLMNDMFANSLIEELPTCSLRSLSIDLNIKTYTFDMVEALIYSFVKSKLTQLHFTGICVLQKERDSWYIGLDSHTPQDTQCLSYRLLRGWSTLFMLTTVNKYVPKIDLTLGAIIDKSSLQILKMLFISLKRISSADTDIDESLLLQSLTGLHLLLTYEQRELATVIIEFLQCRQRSNMKQLSLTFDENILNFPSECQALAISYNQLLSTNKTLEVLSLGVINDTFANEIASGLKNNDTLHTLQFSVGAKSIVSFSNLLQTILESKLTTIHITDGCTIKRKGQTFNVDFFGNITFLCKMFIALVQKSPNSYSRALLASFLPENKLDLTDIVDDEIASSVFECLADNGGSFVSELVLSGSTDLMKNDKDAIYSAIEEILTSDDSTLKTLRLNNFHLSDKVCVKFSEALAENKMLERLDLRNSKLTLHSLNVLFAALAKNSILQELDLSSIEYLKPKLESQVTLVDDIQKMLQVNKVLSVLNLNESTCEPLCRQVAIGLCMNKALRVLSLQIEEEDVVVKLFESVQHCQSLKELYIARSSVDDHLPAGSAICQMLKNNTTLEVLSIQWSGISDEICELIAKGIAHNKILRKLDLSGNCICASGVAYLFEVLDTNAACNLMELDLSNNNPSGLLPITHNPKSDTALATNSTLEILSISDCEFFSQWFGIVLLNGLKLNSKLRTLDISRTYFDKQTIEIFADMLSCNKTLTELNISFSQFSHDGLVDFKKVLSNCPLKKIIVDVKTCSLLDFDHDTFSKAVELDLSFIY